VLGGGAIGMTRWGVVVGGGGVRGRVEVSGSVGPNWLATDTEEMGKRER
jgi:hypothetical protein